MNKLRWGVVSTASIGTEKVIPGLMSSELCEVRAIASRSEDRAKSTAEALGIPVHYGSYEALFNDPDIDAVYNPLPNHLHVPVTIQAIKAGKHVLCEKPIALSVAETRELMDAASKAPAVKVMEAFMYRFHPQWIRAKELVSSDALGELKTIQTFFSYFNDDPDNIRNKADMGGGGLMDIGCYPISQARFLTGREPVRVLATMEVDPAFQVDRITTGILDFGSCTASYTCSTQLSPFQRTQIVGTKGRIEIEIPVNAPPDATSRLYFDNGQTLTEELFDPVDQYGRQGDAFAHAVLNNTDVPTPLSDALANMKVIEASVSSHQRSQWVSIDSD